MTAEADDGRLIDAVLMLVQDLHIRVINAATGELLRELILDPARDYQPTGRPPGPAPKTPRP